MNDEDPVEAKGLLLLMDTVHEFAKVLAHEKLYTFPEEKKNDFQSLESDEDKIDWIVKWKSTDNSDFNKWRHNRFNWYNKGEMFYKELGRWLESIGYNRRESGRLKKIIDYKNALAHAFDSEQKLRQMSRDHKRHQGLLSFEKELDILEEMSEVSNLTGEIRDILKMAWDKNTRSIPPYYKEGKLSDEKLLYYAKRAKGRVPMHWQKIADTKEKLKQMDWKEYIEITIDGNPERIAIQELESRLAKGKRNVVQIIGRGGFGKTALMIQFIRNRLEEDYFENTNFKKYSRYIVLTGKGTKQGDVDSSPGTGEFTTKDPKSGPRTYMENLEFSKVMRYLNSMDDENEPWVNETSDCSENAINLLTEKDWLLVLDNFEDVDSKTDLQKYIDFFNDLPSSAKSSIIITGRPNHSIDDVAKIRLGNLTPKAAQDLMFRRYRFCMDQYRDAFDWRQPLLNDLIRREGLTDQKNLLSELEEDTDLPADFKALLWHPLMIFQIINYMGNKRNLKLFFDEYKRETKGENLEFKDYVKRVVLDPENYRALSKWAEDMYKWYSEKSIGNIVNNRYAVMIIKKLITGGRCSDEELKNYILDSGNVRLEEYTEALQLIKMQEVFIEQSERNNSTIIDYSINESEIRNLVNEPRIFAQGEYETSLERMEEEPQRGDVTAFKNLEALTKFLDQIKSGNFSQEQWNKLVSTVNKYLGTDALAIEFNFFEVAEEIIQLLDGGKAKELTSSIFTIARKTIIEQISRLLNGSADDLKIICINLMLNLGNPTNLDNDIRKEMCDIIAEFVKDEGVRIPPIQENRLSQWLLLYPLQNGLDSDEIISWMKILSFMRSYYKTPEIDKLAGSWRYMRKPLAGIINEIGTNDDSMIPKWIERMKTGVNILIKNDFNWYLDNFQILFGLNLVESKEWPEPTSLDNHHRDFTGWNKYDRPLTLVTLEEFEKKPYTRGDKEWEPGINGLSFDEICPERNIPIFRVVDEYVTKINYESHGVEEEDQVGVLTIPSVGIELEEEDIELEEENLTTDVLNIIRECIVIEPMGFSVDKIQNRLKHLRGMPPNKVISKYTEHDSWKDWLQVKFGILRSNPDERFRKYRWNTDKRVRNSGAGWIEEIDPFEDDEWPFRETLPENTHYAGQCLGYLVKLSKTAPKRLKEEAKILSDLEDSLFYVEPEWSAGKNLILIVIDRYQTRYPNALSHDFLKSILENWMQDNLRDGKYDPEVRPQFNKWLNETLSRFRN